LAHAAMALLIVSAVPVYAAIVAPHSVVRLGMRPAPALLQSTARLEEMIPDHACACEQTDTQIRMKGSRANDLSLIKLLRPSAQITGPFPSHSPLVEKKPYS